MQLQKKKKVLITTPFPSIEEVAEEFGVPLSRVRHIQDLMKRIAPAKKK